MEGPKKDTRPMKDKQWQAERSQELIEFLITQNYNHHISPKIIQSPTRKDFECIFQFLYHKLDPHFDFSGKFEDDVTTLFKRLRYPFEVKKSALFAVGSPQYWPSLLAALSWLVELIKYDIASQDDEPVDFSPADDVMSENGEKLTYQYLPGAYRDFLAGDEEESVETFFGPFYLEKQRLLADEITKLQEEGQQLEATLTSMQGGETPLVQVQARKKEFVSDVQKFEAYIGQLEERLQYFANSKTELEEELQSKSVELIALENEKKQLLDQISSQDVSALEVQEMSIERETLGEQLRAAQSQHEKLMEGIVEGERMATKLVEEIQAAVLAHNSRAAELKLIPNKANVNLELVVNTHGTQADEVLNINPKKEMLPILQKMKSDYNQKVHAMWEELITTKDEMSQLEDEVVEKQGHLKHMEDEIRKVETEVAAQNAGGDDNLHELEQKKGSLEAGIAKSKTDHEEQVGRVKQTVDAVTAEYQEKKLSLAAEKKEMEAQLMKVLQLITEHKAYIQESVAEVDMKTVHVRSSF